MSENGSAVRVLQVGCGGIAGTWFAAARQLPEIIYVGLVDVNLEAARARRDEFAPDALVFDDLATALRETRPQVVFDCTVPAAHTPTARAALEAGASVLSEKPLSDMVANAHLAISAAQTTGGVYAVTQNYRYAAGPRRLKAFLESGMLGRVTTVNADMYLGAHFGGFREAMDHVLLLDMAIHTFDMARFLSGANAQSVFCHEWNPSGSWYGGGPQGRAGASAHAIFAMSDAVVFSFRGSWCATGCPSGFQASWRIIGERGTVLWDGAEGFKCEVEAGEEGFFRPVQIVEIPSGDFGEKTRGHAGIMREFLDALQGGLPPETVASDNLHSLAMVLGAVESAELGQRVAIGT